MIVSWILGLVAPVLEWLALLFSWDGMLPEDFIPAFLDMAEFATSMGVWVPLGAVFAALAFSASVWGACLGIKTLRGALSHIPGWGGSG